MIRQCAVLFGCLALGELVVYLTGVKLPSSIIGMLLLACFLKMGWVKLKWVQGLSDFLVANLGFFFVPSGVALMLYFDIIEAQLRAYIGRNALHDDAGFYYNIYPIDKTMQRAVKELRTKLNKSNKKR